MKNADELLEVASKQGKKTPEELGYSRASGWIPVKERLPEKDGKYLVTHVVSFQTRMIDVYSYANDLYKIDKYDFWDRKGKSGWYDIDREYGGILLDDVVAWMELPEPYKEGQ